MREASWALSPLVASRGAVSVRIIFSIILGHPSNCDLSRPWGRCLIANSIWNAELSPRQSLAMTAALFDAEGVHGGDGGGAVGGNDGREEGADRKRARGYGQGEGVPGGDAVKLGGEQAPGTDG